MSDKEQQLIEQIVRGWRDKLINLTGRNRLLNFRPGKRNSLDINAPDLSDVVERVMSGRPIRVISTDSESELDPDQPIDLLDASDQSPEGENSLFSSESPLDRIREDASFIGSSLAAADIRANLRSLFDHQSTVYLDAGLSISYLAVGILNWADPETPDKPYRSPLVLIPIELKSSSRRAPTTLEAREDDVSANRALSLKLASLDIELPSLEGTSPEAILEYLNAVDRLAKAQPGWSMERNCTVSYFTFHKEAMYQDLADHMDSVTASSLVRALATAGTDYVPDELLFDPADDRDIDILDIPEDALQVLDADSSQRAAILAAREGKSFVLEGPPGTGKSQTIANIIATQIALGRTVLFVSEKIAALEVVKNRLDEIGLGSYLLELHSSKAKRSVVAQDLGKSLHRNAKANTAFKKNERKTLQRQREALSAYAEQMNSQDNALGISLHDLIGEIALRSTLPRTPEASYEMDKLNEDSLADIGEAARSLARAWRPGLEGDGFLWAGSLSTDHPSLDLQRAMDALEELQDVFEPYMTIADELEWNSPPGARLTIDLIAAHQSAPKPLPDDLLTRSDWNSVVQTVELLHELLSQVFESESQLKQIGGERWERVLDLQDQIPLTDTLDGLSQLNPSLTPKDSALVDDLRVLHKSLDGAHGTLTTLTEEAKSVAAALGLLAPDTVDQLADLVEIHERATGQYRPEASWFKTDVDGDVEKAINSLEELHVARSSARKDAEKYFRPNILEANPRELHIRFSNQHTGLRKLSSASRSDKKLVQETCQAGISPKHAISVLPLAVSWQESEEQLQQGVEKFSELLGRRYQGDETDWDSLRKALDNAREIAGKARAAALEQLAQAAAHGSQVDMSMKRSVALIQEQLNELPTYFAELKAFTNVDTLKRLSLEDQTRWFYSSTESIRALITAISDLNSALSRDLSLSVATRIQDQSKLVE